MGQLFYENLIFDYDESENKSLLEVLRDNKIYVNAPCGGNKTCGKCLVEVYNGNFIQNGNIVSVSSQKILACENIPLGNINMPQISKNEILFENFLDNNSSHNGEIGVAIDIGTTTIAAYFYLINSKKLIAIKSAVNEQNSVGADVMSRLQFYIEHDKSDVLHNIIINQINNIILEVSANCGLSTEKITKIIIAGNTVMEHFFSGVDPSPIAEMPYVPNSLFGIEELAFSLGLKANRRAIVYTAPCVSGFVGGDITIGIMACNLDKIDKNVLYIDIGTNGEIALKSNGQIICCATAAGPAFEGANISSGMIAEGGAISKVSQKNGSLSIKTIANKPAIGICGSGIIDAVATFLDLNIIDETGKILCSDMVKLAENVYITQKDIREIQVAKAAISAGIITLLGAAGITQNDVETVILAGGFGEKINPSSAIKIGLIPAFPLEIIQTVGNASGNGACKILLDYDEIDRLQEFSECCKYIELSENSEFNEEYINQMIFPQ
ncbi:MAG: ASKHA domain-containing protein [Oscillospiraceae bacterium]